MNCLICGIEVPDYEPKYCCDGRECGCMGQPVDPCICSNRCWDALIKYIGHPYEERRKLAGIDKH